LADNFRSREPLLQFVNSLCEMLMQPELSPTPYDEKARLRFGAPDQRQKMAAAAQTEPCVELHLRLKQASASPEGESESTEALVELEEAQKEARMIARRLRELKEGQLPIWDEKSMALRPVAWRDMAILLRAPANKAASYAKEFSRLEIPLLASRGGF